MNLTKPTKSPNYDQLNVLLDAGRHGWGWFSQCCNEDGDDNTDVDDNDDNTDRYACCPDLEQEVGDIVAPGLEERGAAGDRGGEDGQRPGHHWGQVVSMGIGIIVSIVKASQDVVQIPTKYHFKWSGTQLG